MSTGRSKFASVSVFCKLESQLSNVINQVPYPVKITGFAQISEIISGKSAFHPAMTAVLLGHEINNIKPCTNMILRPHKSVYRTALELCAKVALNEKVSFSHNTNFFQFRSVELREDI